MNRSPVKLVVPKPEDLARTRIAGCAVATVVDNYETAAYWSSNDETDDSGGGPLDNYMAEHDTQPTPELLALFRYSVVAFLLTCERDGLDLANVEDGQIGHDLWLTRNGHGCGFWDDYKLEHYETEATRDALDSIAHEMGEFNIAACVETNTVEEMGPPLSYYIEQGRVP